MNTTHLKFVIKVAESGSFSKAAELCHVSQPSLSSAVAKLETELGGSLFERDTHNVSITEYGKRLLPLIVGVIDAEEMLTAEVRGVLQPETKEIRIGFCPLVDLSLLESSLQGFRKRFDDVELIMRESFIDDLGAKLKRGRLDVLFVPSESSISGFSTQHFYSEELLFLSDEGKQTEPVSIEEISDKEFTVAGEGCGLVSALSKMFSNQGHTFQRFKGEAMSYSVLEDWANLGIGPTILPRSKVRTKEASLIMRTPKESAIIDFEVVWNHNSPRTQQLVDFLKYFKNTVPKYLKGLTRP